MRPVRVPATPPDAAPSASGALHLRLTLLGLLTTQDLETLFGVTDDTVTRAYQRGDIPPPVKLFGRNVWSAGALTAYVEARLGEALLAAQQAHKQQDTKVAALYGGARHGRRP